MTQVPVEHIADSHKLIADGRVTLFELTPSGGGGTVRFKPDNTVTWRGNVYTGLPIAVTGEKKSSDSGLSMPKMVIGQPDIDLSLFKPLIYDGYLDNAVIIRYTVLLEHVIANLLIREVSTFRVKRVEEYSRSRVSLQLATISDSLGFQMPYRSYLPPDFPSVQM